MKLTYSNPRLQAVIADWPIGRHRTTATFQVESKPGKGERTTRTTLDQDGKPYMPKKLTYSRAQRIVDGSDGKTYVLCWHPPGHVSVMKGDMQYQHESIFDSADPVRFAEVIALFRVGPKCCAPAEATCE